MNQFLQEKGERLLFILTMIQIVFLTGISVYLVLQEEYRDIQDIYKWLILLLFSISQVYYAWHSIIKTNKLELFAYNFICTFVTIAIILRFYYISLESSFGLKILCYVYMIFSVIVAIIGYIASVKLNEDFKFKIFSSQGASMQVQKQYQWSTYFQCLMEVYAQLTFIIFMTFFFFFDWEELINQTNYDIYVDVGGMIFVILIFYLGHYSVKNKKIILVYLYFIFVILISIYENGKLYYSLIEINFDYTKLSLDWATLSSIIIVFSSSSVVLMFQFYYGYRCIQVQKSNAKVEYSTLLLE